MTGYLSFLAVLPAGFLAIAFFSGWLPKGVLQMALLITVLIVAVIGFTFLVGELESMVTNKPF